MHHERLHIPRLGIALIFLLSALPLLPGPAWAQGVSVDPPHAAISAAASLGPPGATIRVQAPANAHPGDVIYASLYLDNPATGFASGGFRLFLEYDSSTLSLLSVEPGQILLDCGWETFSWRQGNAADCGGACPGGTIRIIALADNIYPSGHPLCWDLAAGELARLHFAVSDQSVADTVACDIKWLWYGCTDNEWSSTNGDSLYLSHEVFSSDMIAVTADAAFPNTTGASSACLPTSTISRAMDYQHGRILVFDDTPTEPVRIQLVPRLFHAPQANSIEPVPTTLYIGDLRDCPLEQIDPSSILINGSIIPVSVSEAPAPPDFIRSTALAVDFDARQLVQPLAPVWDTVSVEVGVTWSAPEGCAQGANDSARVVGHRRGDLDSSGDLNMRDLILLAKLMFAQQADTPLPPASDVNASGECNITDLSTLVKILFY